MFEDDDTPEWFTTTYWGARGLAALAFCALPFDRTIALVLFTVAWLIEGTATIAAWTMSDDEEEL